INTIDSEVKYLPKIYFQPIHDAAVAATLKTQWDVLIQDGDEEAQLLFRVAGQFSEAALISTATLGLLAGVSHVTSPGHVSRLERALDHLHDIRLIEELYGNRVRLHTLVREFAGRLTLPDEVPEFRHGCARRVAQTFEDFTNLEDITRTIGVDI